MKRLDPEFYHRIVDEALNGILVFELKTKSCVFANPVAYQLLDWRHEEDINSKRFQDLIPAKPDKRITCFSEDLLQHEGLYQEVLLQKRGGLYLISNLGVKHFFSSGSEYILLMVQDITLQKKLQRELTEKQSEIHRALMDLKQQNQQLRELDLAKNRFIALTTHELRTPLSAMVASAEVLQMGLYDSKEQLQQFIDLIVEQGVHLTRLVNDILDFAKIQAGKMDYYVERMNLIPLLKGRVENFKNMASYADVKIEGKWETNIELFAYYDELRLQQVLDNMINNAIKYNVSGGSVTVTAEDKGSHIQVSVIDTGRGIEKDQLNKVFDEFETLGQVALHHQGTGLGMPISRRMMAAMGGKIEVTSEVGKGSHFWIEIPKEKVLAESNYRSRSTRKAA